jgi:beta-lactamase regulating signal transducer with metallopeptidase domain
MTPIEAVLNTFWQSVLLALLAWLAMRWSPRMNAATRCAIWWAVLAGIVLLPVIRVQRVRHREIITSVPVIETRITAKPLSILPAIRTGPPRGRMELPRGNWTRFVPILWLAVFFTQIFRLAWSAVYLHRLKRDTQPAPPELRAGFESFLLTRRVRRPARLLLSSRIPVPVAVGFWRPAVILPTSLVIQLTPEELDHIVLHEMAHLARRDDWSQLATNLAWSFLALHPVAAWVLRRIAREREIACDDWVVATTGSPRPYAQSLAKLFDLCTSRRGILLASGAAGNGSQLGDRIALLMKRGRAFSDGVSLPRVAAGVILVLAIAATTSRAPAWMAFAQAQDLPSAASTPAGFGVKGHSFLAAVVAAGYGDLPVDDIIALKNQGVSGEYLMGMSKTGWGKLPARKIIELKLQGVTPDYAGRIHGSGFGPYTPDEMIHLKLQGVSPEMCRALKEYGIRQASAVELIEARTHDVGEGTLRNAQAYGSTLTLKQIIRLKQAGVI